MTLNWICGSGLWRVHGDDDDQDGTARCGETGLTPGISFTHNMQGTLGGISSDSLMSTPVHLCSEVCGLLLLCVALAVVYGFYVCHEPQAHWGIVHWQARLAHSGAYLEVVPTNVHDLPIPSLFSAAYLSAHCHEHSPARRYWTAMLPIPAVLRLNFCLKAEKACSTHTLWGHVVKDYFRKAVQVLQNLVHRDEQPF